MAIEIGSRARGASFPRRRVNVMRLAVLAHRYLGIALGVVISAWCVSAFVMMYVQYPELTDAERVAGLAPLSVDAAGASGAQLDALDYAGAIESVRVEMLAGRPVVDVRGTAGRARFDLASGRRLEAVDAERARRVSSTFAARFGVDARFDHVGTLERDQWTVYSSYDPHRPLLKFAADDRARTEWYVSSTTGEVVQTTTAVQRVFGYLGAVTHWIYFTGFREHTGVWAQTIIWLTIGSIFLTVIGLYIGIKQFKRRRSGRWSPYRGAAFFHHVVGLVFGALVLTWLVSGLFSMNPGGALEGRSFAAERARLEGGRLPTAAVGGSLERLADASLPAGSVRLETAMLAGEPSWIATRADGTRERLDMHWRPAPLAASELERSAARLKPAGAIAHEGRLERSDAYYYSHHETAELPVYRIVYEDGERFYLDATSARLVAAFDAERRAYRWLFAALHRGDFAALARMRPVWDLFMLPLLAAVTIGAVTGTWMGIKRLLR